MGLQCDLLSPAMAPCGRRRGISIEDGVSIEEGRTMTMDRAGDMPRLAGARDWHLAREARQRLQHERGACISQRAALEQAAGHIGEDLTMARVAAIRVTLEEIGSALVRLDDGEYGLCQNCRTGTAAGRLEILPHARFCVRCQLAQREP
jgi:RNA polymerase-binding transcription factor